MGRVLSMLAVLDGMGWGAAENYDLTNYWAEGMRADQKLLCHWACYVTERTWTGERDSSSYRGFRLCGLERRPVGVVSGRGKRQ